MIGIGEILDRAIPGARQDRRTEFDAQADRLAGDFGHGAYSEAGPGQLEESDLERSRLLSRVACALAKRMDKRAQARMAMDADVIRFLEAYWPQSPSQLPELSQLEELRRIAADPLAATLQLGDAVDL